MSQQIYSLSDLEKILNLKAHTIRTWEKRYGMICPKRNESNIRYYTEEDKNLLASILLLKNSGCKLRSIATWEPTEIRQQANQLIEKEKLIQKWIDDILAYCLLYDKTSIEYILHKAQEIYSFDKMIHSIILPLFNQFSILWLTGAVHVLHERFLGQLVQNQLVLEVERLKKESKPNRSALLFSPDNSAKAYLLKTIEYLLKKQYYSVHDFGCSLAVREVAPFVTDMSVDEIHILVSEDIVPDSFHDWLNDLSILFKDFPIHVICHPFTRVHPEESHSVHVFNGIEDFRNFLKSKGNN